MTTQLSDLTLLEQTAAIVYRDMTPTPQQRWPLLERRCGSTVWVKHENSTPVGSFKARTALAWFGNVARQQGKPRGVVAATRGNFGQGAAFAGARHGIPVVAVVPHGNSTLKNDAMIGFGAELVEQGHDFQAALEAAHELADTRGWIFMPSFDDSLVRGAATYSLELLRAVPDLDAMYVPIGLGSGICGAIAARDALGLKTRIIGVVSACAPAYALSFAAGHAIEHAATTRIADGVACRVPVGAAVDIIRRGAERVVQVSDDEVEDAMRVLYQDAHTVAEGAGATALAALLQDGTAAHGRVNAIVVTGANVDAPVFARVIASAR